MRTIETPSLDGVIDRMDTRLAELAARRDRRERFLLMYRTFKGELRRNLQEGRFQDVEWSEAICCRMGEMYFEADEAYREGSGCPEPWTHAFDAAGGRRTNLLQDMLLGMNAHINYDLPLCTLDTMRRFGDLEELRDDDSASLRFRRLLRLRYHDFLLINEIAWESIPEIQDVVTERFNRLLKLANILSFRFSRPIAEQIICEYRDRAWAHTLVMLTSDDTGLEPTRRHLSLFALRAAGLVERLTLNPIRHLRRAPVPEAEPAVLEHVVSALVRQLGHRPTRAIARQALIEYGQDIQPILLRTLDRAPPLPGVRAELYAVLAAHPTPPARDALLDALSREREVRDRLLRTLAGLEDHLGSTDWEPLMASAREDLETARELLDMLHALDPDERRGSLLDRALRQRAHSALDGARNALRATDRAPELSLPPGASYLAPVPSLPELGTAAGVMAETVDILTGRAGSPGEDDAGGEEVAGGEVAPDTAGEDTVARLLDHEDRWIRTCAAHWIGTRRPDAGALVRLLEREENELVRETAVRALAERSPEPGDAATRILEEIATADSPVAQPSRALAREILEGETLTMTTIEKVLHLKNVALFQDVLAEDLVSLARVADEHRFRAGEALIREAEPGEAAYVVVEGNVDVLGSDGQALASVGDGAVLGEMSVVSDMPTSADCIAATDGLALRIAREDFHALLQDHPTTAIGVMHVLAQRLRDANERAGEPEPHGSAA